MAHRTGRVSEFDLVNGTNNQLTDGRWKDLAKLVSRVVVVVVQRVRTFGEANYFLQPIFENGTPIQGL